MKSSPNLYHNWKIFLTTSIACLNLLHSSDVLAAKLSVAVPFNNSTATPTISTNKAAVKPTPESDISHNVNQPEGLEEGVPNQILGEIVHLDNLKCFPKLLCTIYQDDAITRQGFFVNATELALAYIKLIRAVHYTSKTTTTEAPKKRKQPIIQIFKIPLGLITASTYPGRKEHLHLHHREDDYDYNSGKYRYHSRSPLPFDDEDDEVEDSFPYEDSQDEHDERDFLREKIEMSQMMQKLKDEDNTELLKSEDFPASGGLATTLLSSFLPFVGSRSARKERSVAFSISSRARDSHRSGRKRKKPQDPFWKAVNMWRKLKRSRECQAMYKTCPFEAWEVVRMLDLVKGQSNVLSAYLKITVDKVKPKRRRQ